MRGTEDWQTIGEGIWSYAWDVAVNGHAPATPFKEYEAGLAIDPPLHRTQHQVSSRLLCVRGCKCPSFGCICVSETRLAIAGTHEPLAACQGAGH